jgi:cytoskeletal protein RodZ
MSMGGKRFSAGILGGLLLGLLIVGGSGFATGLSGSFTAAVPNAESTSSASSSSTVLQLTTSATSGSSPANYSANGSATSTATSVNTISSESSSTATQQTTNQTPQAQAPWYGFFAASISGGTNGGSSQSAPSRLSAIASQPAIVDGLVLLPLLVAIFLGAILYRASSGKKVSPDPELNAD